MYLLDRQIEGQGISTTRPNACRLSMWACAAAASDSGNVRSITTRSVTFAVLEANPRARRFYERLGWRTDGRRQSDTYGGRELSVLHYTRSL